MNVKGTGDNVTITCKECQKAGLKSVYAREKDVQKRDGSENTYSIMLIFLIM